VLREESLVWLDDEQVFGHIVGSMGAFYSTIWYVKGGIEFEVLMENTEFTTMEDLIEYDDDE
jgi:hypothetical protein